jgi:predicted component of type VI protein secretion system
MSFELVVVQGRSLTSTLKLGSGVTTIGRHDDCQLRIKSSQVSRRHCEVFEKKGHLLVKDLGSSNGTLVNGERVQGQRVLEAGDELTIGPIMLRVSRTGEPVASKPLSSPGDTAVSPPVTVAPAGDPDSFVIDLDEPTSPAVPVPAPAAPKAKAAAPKAKAPAGDDDDIADFLMDLPIDGDEAQDPDATQQTSAVAAQARSTGPASATKPAKEQGGAAEHGREVGGDAVADFLLDIKLEDE